MSLVRATYGAELEWADIRRDVEPPPELGRINPAEFNVVNTASPYWGLATDPNGKDPPVGGEINTAVTHSPLHLAEVVQGLRDFYTARGTPPGNNTVGMLHIHVGIPGLETMPDGPYRLAKLLLEQQETMKQRLNVRPLGVERYLDDERVRGLWGFPAIAADMKSWRVENLRGCRSHEEALDMLKRGKDGVTPWPRAKRTWVNLMTLPSIGTIEFRCFCSTVDPAQVLDAAIFCQRFVTKALVDPSIDLYAGLDNLPSSPFDYELALSFLKTKKEGQINPQTGRKFQEGRSGKLARVRQEPLNVERSETLGTPLSELRRRGIR